MQLDESALKWLHDDIEKRTFKLARNIILIEQSWQNLNVLYEPTQFDIDSGIWQRKSTVDMETFLGVEWDEEKEYAAELSRIKMRTNALRQLLEAIS